jgi:hypothetical protein
MVVYNLTRSIRCDLASSLIREAVMQHTALVPIEACLLTSVVGGAAADPDAFAKFQKSAIDQAGSMAPDLVKVLKAAKCPQSEEEGEALHKKCLAAIPSIGRGMAEPRLGDSIKKLFPKTA